MEPQNTYIWAVVAPTFLSGHAFDVVATNVTAASRANLQVWGLNTATPQRMVRGPLGNPGNLIKTPVSYPENIARIQGEMVAKDPRYTNLSTFDCLQRYTTLERDASDVVLVSSEDTLNSSSQVSQAENSLLVSNQMGNTWVWIGPHGVHWECGHSNSFSCPRPQTWTSNESLVVDWNVYGYKIDYCLSKDQDLGEKCSVRLDVPIMIGM